MNVDPVCCPVKRFFLGTKKQPTEQSAVQAIVNNNGLNKAVQRTFFNKLKFDCDLVLYFLLSPGAQC